MNATEGGGRPGDREASNGGPSPAGEDLKRKSLGGLAWLSSSSLINGVLNVVVLAILGRLLTPDEFGLVGAAMVVIWLSTIFSELGVGQAIVQRPSLEQRHVDSGFTLSVLLGLAFAALIWSTASLVAAFFQMDRLVSIVRALAILFPITGVGVVAESLLQRDLRFGSIARIEVAAYGVGYSAVSVILAALGFGVWSLVGGNLFKAMLRTTLLLVAEPHSKRPRLELAASRELLDYGVGYTAGRLSTYFALQGDALVVGRTLGAEALGYYGRAYSIMTMPAKAGGSIVSRVLFPAMSRVQDDRERLASLYRKGIGLLATAILPVSAIAIVLAPEFVRVYLGPGWEGTVLPFQILAVAMFWRIGYLVGGVVARSTGAVYRLAWRNAVYAGLVVFGAWAGHYLGLPGTAAGVCVALLANYLLTSQLANALIAISWREFWAEHARPLLLAVAFGAEALGVAAALRGTGAGAILILLLGAAVPVATGLFVLRLRPALLLGRHADWVLGILDRYAPDTLLRVLVRREAVP